MNRDQRRVVIVGGGITGLSAAFYIRKFCREKDIPVHITLIERSPRLGGKICTLRKDGHVIERGPDSILARKTPIIDLTRDLGLESELVPTNPEAGKTYIVRRGEFHRMPQGAVLGIPTRLGPFFRSGLISPAGKARAVLDLFLPARREEGDESLGSFVRRRLGSEVLEYMTDPVLAGIYSADLDRLSLRATYPQFHEVEHKYRSLIRGMAKASGRPQAAGSGQTGGTPAGSAQAAGQTASAARPLPEHLRHSMFLSYRNGLYTLIEQLEERSRGIEMITGEEVVRLERAENGLRLATASGRTVEADAAVLAVPAFVLGALLPESPAAQMFARMPYVSVANVVFGYDKAALKRALDGSGFVIPRKERRFITACTWMSSKWGHTAPEGRALLRCYVGRAGEEGWTLLSDEEIIANVKEEVRRLMGIEAEPDLIELNKHMHAMPQYEVGHLDRVKALRQELRASMPEVVAAGSAFEGIGVPDCVRQGKEAAMYVAERLEHAPRHE